MPSLLLQAAPRPRLGICWPKKTRASKSLSERYLLFPCAGFSPDYKAIVLKFTAVSLNSRFIDRCAVATGIRIHARRHGVHRLRVRSGRQVDGQAGHGKGRVRTSAAIYRACVMTEDAALHAVRDHDRMLRHGSVRQSKNTRTDRMSN